MFSGAYSAIKGMWGAAPEILSQEVSRNGVIDAAASRALRGAMWGAGIGAGYSLVDGDPSTGVIGGALRGGLTGGVIGGLGGGIYNLGQRSNVFASTNGAGKRPMYDRLFGYYPNK